MPVFEVLRRSFKRIEVLTIKFPERGKFNYICNSRKTKESNKQEFTYGESESKTITVKHTYPVKVPANYRADLSVVFFKYQMDVDYIVTCRGLTSGKIIEIKGIWNNVDVEETDTNLTLTSLDGGTIQKKKISKEMLDSKKVIEI